LLLLRGIGPLGPNSRRLLGRRLTRHSQSGRFSRYRSFDPSTARHRLAVMSFTIDPAWFASRGSRRIGVVISQRQLRYDGPWCVLRLPVNRPCDRPHRPNPCSFYEPGLPLETQLSMLLHADPPRVVAAERAFTTKSTDLWRPLSPAGTLLRHHPPRARRACRFHERARLTPPISRKATHRANACAPARSSDPVAFRRRFRRRPAWPEPLLPHPSEGMMQPRLGTSSTVSTDCLLAPAIRNAVNS